MIVWAIIIGVVPVHVYALPSNELAAPSACQQVFCKNEEEPINKLLVEKSLEKGEKMAAKKRKRRRKSELSVFKKEQAQELMRSSLQLGLGIGLLGGIGYLIGGANTFQASTFMGPLISGMVTDPLTKIGGKLCSLFTPYLSNPGVRKAMAYRIQYENRKHMLTDSMQEFLDTLIKKYTHWVDLAGYESKDTEKVLDEILNFPVVPQPVSCDIAPICELIKHYPVEVRLMVGDMVVGAMAESKISKLEKKSVPLMFVGPPGTGKTHLASQIGGLLGLSVQILDITKYKSINGTPDWSNSTENGVIVDILTGGKTATGNFSNKVVVLDEIDKALAKDENGRFLYDIGPELVSLLHTLLETQETEARLHKYGGASYDISHLKMILIGNRTFSEVLGKEYAAALESRVHVVNFHGFSDEQKLAILQEHINKLCVLYPEIPYDKIDQKIVEEIVAMDTKMGNEGVRILLKVVEQYVRMLHQGELIGKIAGVPSVVFDVHKAYAREESPEVNKHKHEGFKK
eukprot:gene145-195_t